MMRENYTDRDYIISLRRELHRCAEIGYELPKTTAIVKRELEKIGLAYTEEYGYSSIVSYINPEKQGITIALRADMDALPIEERTGLPFASENNGMMHACGHDAHTACLVGAARALYSMRDSLDCRIKLIFQANEEGEESAADRLVKRGVLDDVDIILGLHTDNTVPSGYIGVCPGASMASCRNFTLEIFGRTAHAALSHTGADALAAAVMTYNEIQVMLTRRVDPKHSCVCAIGSLHSGETQNVVADYAVMKGTVRTYDMSVDAYIYGQICEIVKNAASLHGCTYKVSSSDVLPAVYNDPRLSEQLMASARELLGEGRVCEIAPKMSSEDFADYLTVRPGVFFRIGTADTYSDSQTLAHNNDFVIDESALSVGADTFVKFIMDYIK